MNITLSIANDKSFKEIILKRKKTSHSAERYLENDKKSIKLFVIFVIIILIIVSIILMCNFKNDDTNNEKQQIKIAINDVFIALKSVNSENINKYIDYDSLISGFDPILVETKSDTSNEIKKYLFQNIEWSIENIEINGDEAIAIVEVTNLNFKVIITNWMKQIVLISSDNVVITNEIALDELKNVIEQDVETKTILEKIKLIRYENKWYIELNENFRNLVFPGIDNVIAALN